MARSIVVETTFLIDLEREHARGTPGRAVEYLEQHPDDHFYLPYVVAGELAAGLSMQSRQRWERFLAPFYLLPQTPDVCWEYGRVFRHLQSSGQLIGANDLWTAATALAQGMPVLTRDVDHFRRVPHLEVESY